MWDLVASAAAVIVLQPVPAPAPEPPPSNALNCVVPVTVLPVASPAVPRAVTPCPVPDPRPPLSCVVPVSVPTPGLVERHCPRPDPTPESRVVPVSEVVAGWPTR